MAAWMIARAVFDALGAKTFAAFWTKKEALFKLRGTGITHELRNVLTLLQPNERLETTLFEEKKYAFTLALTIH